MPAPLLRTRSALAAAITAALAVPALVVLGAPPAGADICPPVPGLPCLPAPGGPTATTPAAITGSPRVALVLTAAAPVWTEPGVVTTYQWQRDGVALVGATAQTYTVQVDDIGRSLTVVARGTLALVNATDSTSAPVIGRTGLAPTATGRPTITGSPRVGDELTATPGTWSGAPVPTYSYQWYRTTGPARGLLDGETGSTYVVRPGDAGARLAVVVTAYRRGYEPGTATATTAVPRTATTTTLTSAARRISSRQRGVVTIRLRSALEDPFGPVRILDGRRLLLTTTVGPGARGVRKVTLPRLDAGKHALTAAFAGSGGTAPSVSKKLVLTVTR